MKSKRNEIITFFTLEFINPNIKEAYFKATEQLNIDLHTILVSVFTILQLAVILFNLYA